MKKNKILIVEDELIVAEVLQSAEAMKSAVAHLEPHMESSDAIGGRGTIILATVKGDVHDIGKNLVDIILSNNGYKVINLGIRVPPYDLIEAYNIYKPDIIGLSGLLVKSAQMMIDTARDFRVAGLNVPVMVGGAALTNRFTRLRIAPEYAGPVAYAQDAMSGLELARKLVSESDRADLAISLAEESAKLLKDEEEKRQNPESLKRYKRNKISVKPVRIPPVPPDLKLHVIRDHDLAEIFPYINPLMLYVRHLGFRGRFKEQLERGEKKAVELRQHVKQVEEAMLKASNVTAQKKV